MYPLNPGLGDRSKPFGWIGVPGLRDDLSAADTCDFIIHYAVEQALDPQIVGRPGISNSQHYPVAMGSSDTLVSRPSVIEAFRRDRKYPHFRISTKNFESSVC